MDILSCNHRFFYFHEIMDECDRNIEILCTERKGEIYFFNASTFFPIAGKDIYLNFIIIIISLRIKVFIRGSLIIVVRIYFISFFFSFLSFFSFYVIRKWITFFFFFNFEVETYETKSGLHFLLLLFNFFIHCLICILSVWRDCTQRKE